MSEAEAEADSQPPETPAEGSELGALVVGISGVVISVILIALVLLRSPAGGPPAAMQVVLAQRTASQQFQAVPAVPEFTETLPAAESAQQLASRLENLPKQDRAVKRLDLDEWVVGGPSRPVSTSVNAIAPEERWSLYFPDGIELEDYAAQLDFLNVELGVLNADGTVQYASNLDAEMPDTREGPAAAERRLYMSWNRGDLQAADQALLEKANISAAGRIVLHFYPVATEKLFEQVEKDYRGRTPSEIATTRFGIRPKSKTYELYVIEQIPRR